MKQNILMITFEKIEERSFGFLEKMGINISKSSETKGYFTKIGIPLSYILSTYLSWSF